MRVRYNRKETNGLLTCLITQFISRRGKLTEDIQSNKAVMRQDCLIISLTLLNIRARVLANNLLKEFQRAYVDVSRYALREYLYNE